MDRQNDHLGVNKMGKNIKKSPMHQPNFANAARQPPQPHVYNINKNDFRSIVQQLTGSPLRETPPRPTQNPPRGPSNRLQRIRPPPLTPMNRPPIAMHPPAPLQGNGQHPMMTGGGYNNNFVRPPPHYGQPQPSRPVVPPTPNDVWANTAESPISAYMRYLQHSFIDSGTGQPQGQGMLQGSGQHQAQPHAPGLLPNPHAPALLSPRMNGPPHLPSPRGNGPPHLPSPRGNGPLLPHPAPGIHGPPVPFPSPRMNGPPLLSPRGNGPFPPFPSPRNNGPPPLLPSPTSQFLLPSPTGFSNLLSPYSFLSPGGYQHPPPFSPNFSFSPLAQSGILGPGPGPQPPPSPGYGFPLSPSGFFPMSSPRWRNQ